MIKVVDKSLNIIEVLARNPQREFTLTEIAKELEMDRGTCTNIIRTLLQRGYVQQSAPRCGYKFGYMFYKLTDNSVNNENLTIIANYSPEHLQRFISRVGLPTEDEWPEVYNTPQPWKELANRLAEIKLAGYEVFIGNNNITAIAAPLFRDGHVVGSIGVYLPSDRMNNSILPSVLESAKIINEKIAALVSASN